MADRTHTTIGVRVSTREQLKTYRKALRSQYGRKATTDELLVAFMEGIPLAHAAFMVDTYNMQHEASEGDEDDEG